MVRKQIHFYMHSANSYALGIPLQRLISDKAENETNTSPLQIGEVLL